MVSNIRAKYHKVVIKITGHGDWTPSKKFLVNFHEQRAITPKGIVQYKPLSNLKKPLS